MSRPLSATVMERRRATQTRRFPHVCDIWRAAVTGTNSRGETEYAGAVLHLEDVGCLLFSTGDGRTTGGRGEQFTPERNTVTRSWQMHLAAETDVLVSDTVRNVRNQSGDPMGAPEYAITQTVEHPSVVLLVLEAVA